MNPLYVLMVPAALTAAACGATKPRRLLDLLNLVGATSTFVLGAWTTIDVTRHGPLTGANGFLYADGLSALLILIISLVAFACAVYSVGYMGQEVDHGHVSEARLRLYYVFFHAFVFTMLLVAVSNNLGILWISIEATTLASAFLVGFYGKEASLEAAWKYLIIGSVGITLALMGTILVYFSAVHVLGESSDALNWTTLVGVAEQLNPLVVKLAFVFVLVGYGTKAGLAPMHTWLPDAHSQAPTPISALLSGVLLNCALYGILRFHVIAQGALGDFSGNFLIFFGLLSLGIAAPFILVAKDYKRLLAYSSVEHIGIISLAVGFGGWLGIFGGLLHMFNHAVGKSMLFFVAGNLNLKYGTRRIEAVKGALRILPVTGVLLIVGLLAITGSPPFSLFLSEFTVLNAGFLTGHFVAVGLYLLFLLIIFAGFLYNLGGMAFGTMDSPPPRGEISRWNTFTMLFLLSFLVVLGLYIPQPFLHLLEAAAAALGVQP